ncbi:hypothetical protein B4U80_03540 [Leptotrombidium deliense]|uniref:Myb-like domain-containing protein n=1 Tax=Leptotrombidium deliense TaxID=299467 RepID=A0A443SE90_9ACAR|nr:hypothetical protein B4U80_03540 [Leptotrombidium deliense]
MEKEKEKNVKSKRSIRMKIAKNVGDKSKLTMFDLLSYNPPLSKEQREMNETRDSEQNPVESVIASEDADEFEETNESNVESGENEKNSGPRVKVGPNGEIILDEESCIIKRKKTKSTAPPIHENSRQVATTYASFRSREGLSKTRWSEKETVRFYTALALIGTDFTLMSTLFFKGKRSRLDLRNKFKKEERTHKALVDHALKRCDLTNLPDLEKLDEMVSSDDDEGIIGADDSEEDEDESPKKLICDKRRDANDKDTEYSTRCSVTPVPVLDRVTRSKSNKNNSVAIN